MQPSVASMPPETRCREIRVYDQCIPQLVFTFRLLLRVTSLSHSQPYNVCDKKRESRRREEDRREKEGGCRRKVEGVRKLEANRFPKCKKEKDKKR